MNTFVSLIATFGLIPFVSTRGPPVCTLGAADPVVKSGCTLGFFMWIGGVPRFMFRIGGPSNFMCESGAYLVSCLGLGYL